MALPRRTRRLGEQPSPSMSRSQAQLPSLCSPSMAAPCQRPQWPWSSTVRARRRSLSACAQGSWAENIRRRQARTRRPMISMLLCWQSGTSPSSGQAGWRSAAHRQWAPSASRPRCDRCSTRLSVARWPHPLQAARALSLALLPGFGAFLHSFCRIGRATLGVGCSWTVCGTTCRWNSSSDTCRLWRISRPTPSIGTSQMTRIGAYTFQRDPDL
mmetsp:Transcript_122458/g.307918  ORF Transcript_122458/g.307918 Transcript_122458/m.307918 type:complete len:214 (-) Transcript_122458:114-755(-)